MKQKLKEISPETELKLGYSLWLMHRLFVKDIELYDEYQNQIAIVLENGEEENSKDITF